MITTTIKHNEKDEVSKYPYIGVHVDGAVVLFTAEKVGFCIQKSTFDSVGSSASDWTEEAFTPLNGSITLEQKL